MTIDNEHELSSFAVLVGPLSSSTSMLLSIFTRPCSGFLVALALAEAPKAISCFLGVTVAV